MHRISYDGILNNGGQSYNSGYVKSGKVDKFSIFNDGKHNCEDCHEYNEANAPYAVGQNVIAGFIAQHFVDLVADISEALSAATVGG